MKDARDRPAERGMLGRTGTGSFRSLQVLLLGGDVAGNLGDRAIRGVLADLIRTALPGSEAWVVSRQPARDTAEFGVRIAARSAPALFGRPLFLRTLDLVCFGGGQMLQDDSSLVKNLYWAVVLQAVRKCTRARLMGCGIGIGPLNTRFGRFCAARALGTLSHCMVRDSRSAEWARQLTRGRLQVREAPDLAVALEMVPPEEAWRRLHTCDGIEPDPSVVTVGVGVRRFFPDRGSWRPCAWRYRESRRSLSEFEPFLVRLAEGLNHFAGQRPARFLFFPFYTSAWQDDTVCAEAISAKLTPPGHVVQTNIPVSLVKGMIGCCDLFLGMPMHSTILALGAGVPCVGLAPGEKGRAFYRSSGLDDLIFPADHLFEPAGPRDLARLLDRVWTERSSWRARLASLWPTLLAGTRHYQEVMTGLMKETP